MENYTEKKCPICKNPINAGDEDVVCPSCSVTYHKNCWDKNGGCSTYGCSCNHEPPKTVNYADSADLGGLSPKSDNPTVQRRNNRISTPVIVLIILLMVILIVLLIFFLVPPKVKTITLSESDITLEKDDTENVSYTITPGRAEGRVNITWESTDPGVATVDNNGNINAVGRGSCTISANADDISSYVQVTVTAGPDFYQIFDDCSLDEEWATIGYDGKYLKIDTNPYDRDEELDYAAYLGIDMVNMSLGLPSSLMEKMETTVALDGRQEETYDDVTVSWRYHPDQGLEVTYESND